jgi:glycosyltransferase involved in cell wall biosynthesis
MMRIALVSEHANPLATLGGVDAGGQNVHVAALAEALARRGAHVVVHTRRDDPHSPDQVVMAPNVVVDHVPAGPPTSIPKDALLPYMGEFARHLQRKWCFRPPDIVHSHFWMSGYASLRAARPLELPLVHTFHALGVVKRRHQGAKDTSPVEREAIEHDVLLHANQIVATCTDEVFELVRLGGDPSKLTIVPCGVDSTRFTRDGPAEPRGDRHRLVSVSRLVERKGIGNVIEALASIPGAELIVAGGPDPRHVAIDEDVRRLRALAERHEVTDRVVFRGRVGRAELPALLRSSDVAVCVPWYEPFGIVPLEAMACGVPVVASAVGGLKDTVVHGVTGMHVPPRSPGAVADAIRDLLDDDRLREAMGVAGRRRVVQRFTWDRVAARTLAGYRSVCSSGSASSRQVQS